MDRTEFFRRVAVDCAQACPKGPLAVGSLRVWWIPQVPMPAFHVPVVSVSEARLILKTLAEYDLFQLAHKVKPDFCNAGGLQIYEDCGEGVPEWCEWYDPETGDDINSVDVL